MARRRGAIRHDRGKCFIAGLSFRPQLDVRAHDPDALNAGAHAGRESAIAPPYGRRGRESRWPGGARWAGPRERLPRSRSEPPRPTRRRTKSKVTGHRAGSLTCRAPSPRPSGSGPRPRPPSGPRGSPRPRATGRARSRPPRTRPGRSSSGPGRSARCRAGRARTRTPSAAPAPGPVKPSASSTRSAGDRLGRARHLAHLRAGPSRARPPRDVGDLDAGHVLVAADEPAGRRRVAARVLAPERRRLLLPVVELVDLRPLGPRVVGGACRAAGRGSRAGGRRRRPGGSPCPRSRCRCRRRRSPRRRLPAASIGASASVAAVEQPPRVAAQEAHREVDAAQLAAGHGQVAGDGGAGREDHGVVLRQQRDRRRRPRRPSRR